jgi:hypothetical protein
VGFRKESRQQILTAESPLIEQSAADDSAHKVKEELSAQKYGGLL